MPYINVEKATRIRDFSMSDLHSHPHYEIYFLVKGKRSFFLSNKMYSLEGPVVVIIPPYVMHKTEGGPYERFNVYVTANYLNGFQSKILKSKALDTLIPDDNQIERLTEILEEMIAIKDSRYKVDITKTLFSYYAYLLDKLETEDAAPITTSADKKHSLVTLKVIAYLNEHYREKLTLDDLAEKFFISKSSLNYNFKNAISSTPMDFLLSIRITAAKKLLLETNKSIQEISEECGFSSPNYFCLIFKRRELVSPATYRKMGE